MSVAIHSTTTVEQPSRTRAIVAGSVGNVLEWYDFAVYAFLVPVISSLFFPAKTELLSILFAFAAFGAGFVTRPLGAILFGIYGDRAGRRASLAAISILMGLATLTIGLLPTYETVGVWATVALVCARLLQGLSAGGEYGGAIPFLVEFAAKGKRGVVGSWQQIGNGLGLLLGALFAYALTASLSAEDLKNWGWRIPFILGALPAVVGIYLRLRLPDTPVFEKLELQSAKAVTPLRAVATTYRSNTLLVFAMVLQLAVGFYIVLTFMPTYLGLVSRLTRADALLITSAGLVSYMVFCFIAGALSDRWGRKPLLLISSIGYVVLTYPLFLLVASGQFALALFAEIVMAALLGFAGGPISAACAEAAPAKVRSTVVAIGVAFSITIFGGFAPFLGTYLIATFNTPLAPAFYAIAAAAITSVVVFRMRETAFDEMT
ncbi:MFS transporter [Phreatobacter stygius]|uniref:MFS transporter n=1 Tax=Phreatobacter stygius TaxID=1940610 RepID=A0A4D7B5P6_9HYPH|nr:MFS transporter [Phreatobacter stygius]QCI68341.1 MFS transporter [Phreatobacter stygius]